VGADDQFSCIGKENDSELPLDQFVDSVVEPVLQVRVAGWTVLGATLQKIEHPVVAGAVVGALIFQEGQKLCFARLIADGMDGVLAFMQLEQLRS